MQIWLNHVILKNSKRETIVNVSSSKVRGYFERYWYAFYRYEVGSQMERQGSWIPCKLFEYFHATPAVDTAPITLPVRPKFTASLAVFNWKGTISSQWMRNLEACTWTLTNRNLRNLPLPSRYVGKMWNKMTTMLNPPVFKVICYLSSYQNFIQKNV